MSAVNNWGWVAQAGLEKVTLFACTRGHGQPSEISRSPLICRTRPVCANAFFSIGARSQFQPNMPTNNTARMTNANTRLAAHFSVRKIMVIISR